MNKKPFMRTLEEVALIMISVMVASIFFSVIKAIFPPVVTLIILIALFLFMVYLIYRVNRKNSK